MAKKVKKYANGGGYYETVNPSSSVKKPEPKPQPLKVKGWNIPELRSEK